MSMIEKMSILGIRSFGPQDSDRQVITFFTPLTLILGQNGSGKTTIIECLRYATTNDLPPFCGKGGPFVHDPKLAGELEVKGQVRLQFRDLADKRMTITRSLISTQKLKQTTTKTLEGYIQKLSATGEKVTLSSKCAELNVQMTDYLGVSRAVLNSVIFCHQEESNWPLGEGKQVKERFDQIFAATRYIKALDNIRNIRRNMMGEIKIYKSEIMFLEQNKDKAKQTKLDLTNTETRLLSSRNRVQEINKRLKPIEEKLEVLSATEGEIHAIEIKLENQETLLKQLEKNKRDLRSVIQNIFDGSAEELKREINTFKSEKDNKTYTLDNAKRKKVNLDQENERLRRRQSELNMNIGKQKTLEQQNKERIRKRDEKIAVAAEALNIPGYEANVREPFEDGKVSAFMTKLQENVDVCTEDYQKTKANYDKQENLLQTKIDEIKDKRAQGEQKLRMNKERLIKNKNEIDSIVRDLRRVDSSAHRQHELETNLKELNSEQTKLESSVNIEELKSTIGALQKKKSALSSKVNLLDQEMSKLQLESKNRAELDLFEKDKKTKEETIHKITNRNEDTLLNLLGKVPARNANRELEVFSKKLTSETREMENQIVNLKTKMSSLETKRIHQMEDLKKNENLLGSHQDKIFQVCGSNDFDDSLKLLQKTLQELQDEKGALIGSEYIYGKYIEKLDSPKPCCPLCQRGFAEDSESAELKSHIRRKIEMVPDQLKKKERHIEEQQKRLASMLGLKPLFDEIKVLTDKTIPECKKESKTTNERIETLRKEITEAEDTVEMKQMDLASCASIQPDMILLHQHQNELTRLDSQILELKKKFNMSGDSRNIQEVNREREDAQNDFQQTMKAVETKQQQLSVHNEKLNSLHSQINSKTAELLQIKADQQKRQSLMEQKNKLGSENEDLDKAIQESREFIRTIETNLEEIKSDKDQVISAKDLEIGDIQKQIEKLNTHKINIEHYSKEIQRYIKEGQSKILADLEEKLNSLKSQIEEKDDAIQRASETIQKLQTEIANQEVKERELLDNKKLKECEEDISELQRKSQELQKKLGNIDTSNLFREKNQLLREHQDLNKEKAEAEGRMREIQEKIIHFKKELNSEQFKDADVKYKNKLIDLKVGEYASDDLNKYYMALDSAVMKHHSLKMDEINKIIRELWMRTYKGNDIDYIEIRSDHTECSTDKRRTYNYRVVMICGESELDMRARCSAGQKVLASLIIRLALAETFCLNCGILALDEPTTNLDRDNIESLAFALVEVIKSRAAQKNFQLVIITHDEDFINLLGRAQFCEYFYKVGKEVNSCTRVKKCSMAELNG